MSHRKVSRRQVLRGAGVALALPLLPSLLSRRGAAQLTAPPTRYVSLYFPNGTAAYWRPREEGTGGAWQLSPILEPLAPVKPYVSVLTNMSNTAPFGGRVEPSHSNLCASTWTSVRAGGAGNNDNGISVDQVVARHIGASSPLDSIQVGLSTLNSFEDGLPGQHSRSISWRSATEPLYKIVNPQALFDRLTGGVLQGAGGEPSAAAADRRRALQQSVLDAVLGEANALQPRLASSDRDRLDQFMTSVRELEQRIEGFSDAVPGAAVCQERVRPEATYGVDNVPAGYDRNQHAELMIDLVVMAFECDITRVCSFMLDDARSDFVYDFLTERIFDDSGSTEGSARVAGYHGLQHAGDFNNGFASITHWNAQKAAQLAGRLQAIPEGDGNVLDHTAITFCSGMNGGDHDPSPLPVALIGGGGRDASGTTRLKRDRHVVYGQETQLSDVHLTLMQHVFGCPEQSFGVSSSIVDDLLS